jgi:hypothetical protein
VNGEARIKRRSGLVRDPTDRPHTLFNAELLNFLDDGSNLLEIMGT